MSEFAYANVRGFKNTKAGIAEYALIAPVSFFAANGIKSPVAPFNNPGDSIIVKTPHEFLPNKGFMYMQLAPQKNNLVAPTTGALGVASQNQEATLFVPGNDPAFHELYQQGLLNVPLIALLKDINCGSNLLMQLGCDCTSAWLVGDWAAGLSKDGEKGYTIKIQYDGAIQFYQVDGGPAVLAD